MSSIHVLDAMRLTPFSRARRRLERASNFNLSFQEGWEARRSAALRDFKHVLSRRLQRQGRLGARWSNLNPLLDTLADALSTYKRTGLEKQACFCLYTGAHLLLHSSPSEHHVRYFGRLGLLAESIGYGDLAAVWQAYISQPSNPMVLV
jgi:hypothetical protein